MRSAALVGIVCTLVNIDTHHDLPTLNQAPAARSVGSGCSRAARFLLPLSAVGEDDPAWSRAARWFVPLGLLIGIMYAIVFRVTWRWFGEYQYIRFVPVACVLAIDIAWGGYRLISAAAAVASRRDSDNTAPRPLELPAAVTIVLIIILKYALLLSLPMGRQLEWARWRNLLGFLYPLVIYRPLILMPLWGRWAMVLAMGIGRTSPGASGRLRSMAGGSRLRGTILWWLGCAALTVFYGSGTAGQLGRAVMIALGVLMVTYLVSFVLARRFGGQTESTVLVTGLAGEMSFLTFYIPVASGIYWY